MFVAKSNETKVRLKRIHKEFSVESFNKLFSFIKFVINYIIDILNTCGFYFVYWKPHLRGFYSKINHAKEFLRVWPVLTVKIFTLWTNNCNCWYDERCLLTSTFKDFFRLHCCLLNDFTAIIFVVFLIFGKAD